MGVDAMLVADVSLEEAGPLHQAMQAAELAPIMLQALEGKARAFAGALRRG